MVATSAYKAIFIACVAGVLCYASQENTQHLSVAVHAQQHQKMPLTLVIIEKTPREDLRSMASYMAKALEFTGQFKVDIRYTQQPLTKKELDLLWASGIAQVAYVCEAEDELSIEWRIYDTSSGQQVEGKKYHKQGNVMRGWAYAVADGIWQAVTGQEGFFSTKIVFCKNSTMPGSKKSRSQLVIADYDGSHQEVLSDTPTLKVSPRWNKDIKQPLVFYSEHTNTNVRMVAVGMNKNSKVASNFDGLNMLPTFSQDGKSVIYCASRGDGVCQLYYYRSGVFKRLTHNEGNNISPTLAKDGSVLYFCSDFESNMPQIYRYTLHNALVEKITAGGYCVSPVYSSNKRQVAYGKLINGIMQIIIYDERSGVHKQLTHDKAQKSDINWSACGNYIMCSVEDNKNSRIALFNVATGTPQFLTAAYESVKYPAWSSSYSCLPVIA